MYNYMSLILVRRPQLSKETHVSFELSKQWRAVLFCLELFRRKVVLIYATEKQKACRYIFGPSITAYGSSSLNAKKARHINL
jgi:hypothetical protein